MDIKVSVIIPCYNAEKFINRCIDSVLGQTFQNFEIWVIDDASTDGTLSCLSKYKDKRLNIVSLKTNTGSPATPRNIGISRSEGKYIAFLDCDDIWCPDKLEVHLEYMEANEYLFSCTSYYVRKLDKTVSKREARAQANFQDILSLNTIGCSTVIISKSVISNFEFADRQLEDFDLWLSILSHGYNVYGLNKHLTIYTKNQNSRGKLNFQKFLRYHEIFKNHGSFGHVGVIIFMLRYLKNRFIGLNF